MRLSKDMEYSLYRIIKRQITPFLIVFILLSIVYFIYSITNIKYTYTAIISDNSEIYNYKNIFAPLIQKSEAASAKPEAKFKTGVFLNFLINNNDFIAKVIINNRKNNTSQNAVNDEIIEKIKRNIFIKQLNNQNYEIGYIAETKEESQKILQAIIDVLISYDISESLRNEKKQYLQHLKNQIDKIIECFENSLIQLQNYYINNPNLQNTTLSISDYYANIKNLIKKKRVLNENKSNIKIYEKIIEEIDKLPLNFLFTKNIEKILPLIEKNVFLKTEYQEIFKLENERMTLTQYQNEQNKNKINELTDTINKKRTQLKNGILLALKKELTDLLKENELFIFEINELEKKVKTTPNDHIRLSTLEKNVELTQQLYQNKIKEYISYEIGNIETPQIYVLQKPKYQSPYQSIYYQRNLSTFVIIFLIIAVAVSIILELFNQKIFEISELENYITEKNCEIIVLKKYKNKIENIEHLSVWLNMHTGKKMALLFDDCFAENIINDLKKNYVMLLNNDCEIYEFFKNNKEQIEIIVFVNLKKTLKKRVMNILKLFDILKIQPKLFIFFDK